MMGCVHAESVMGKAKVNSFFERLFRVRYTPWKEETLPWLVFRIASLVFVAGLIAYGLHLHFFA